MGLCTGCTTDQENFYWTLFYEGVIRFKENGKTGFANRKEEKVIPAVYNNLSYFNFSFATYCRGCYEAKNQREDHPSLTGEPLGYLTYEGKEIFPIRKRNHVKDVKINDFVYIPYQFRYTKAEEKILFYFEERKEIMVNGINSIADTKENKIFFEIIERPSKDYPYYHVKAFERKNDFIFEGADWMLYRNFAVSKNSKYFYIFNEEGIRIPLDEWITQNNL